MIIKAVGSIYNEGSDLLKYLLFMFICTVASFEILKFQSVIYLKGPSAGRRREGIKNLNISHGYCKSLGFKYFSNLSVIHFGGVKEFLTRLLKPHVNSLPQVFDFIKLVFF